MLREKGLGKKMIKEIADKAESIKPESKSKRGGRPAKYQDTFAQQAEKLCALGATDEDLAEFFDVSIRTIANWKTQHEQFLHALKGGKDKADDRVERSLYQRAIGYSHDAVKIMQFQGTPVVVPYTEHFAPDTTAMIFWLKNRRPDQWRDKHDHEHTGRDGAPLVPVINVSVSGD